MKRSERANESQRGVAGLVDDANVRGPVIALRLHNAIDLADNEFDVYSRFLFRLRYIIA